MVDHDLHVIALLGKALRDGGVSREYQDRLQGFAEFLSQQPESDRLYVAICGGQGEAHVAFEWLAGNHPKLLPPEQRCFKDQLSENTVQNFNALGRYLNSLLSPGTQRLRLSVLSSAYHLERIQFVESHLEPQSLIRHVKFAVHPRLLHFVPVAYRPLQSADAIVRAFAQVYLLSERMLPLQINLEGVMQSRINRLVGAVFAEFEEGLQQLADLLDNEGGVLQRGGCNDELFTLQRTVVMLAEQQERLLPFIDRICASTRILGGILTVVTAALTGIRDLSDTDQHKFDGFFDS